MRDGFAGLNIKKSNIRIWIHQRDLNHLQQVIWEGHGNKLLVEHSNNPKVKKFLEAVPHMLVAIKDVHADVVNDNLEGFKEHTSPPVPNILYVAKDINGLTPLHKAAGLGRYDIAEYIVAHNPRSISMVDNEGRTPLHYAVLLKDGGRMFDYLIEAGADEGTLDYKSKSAGFYKTRHNELDAKQLLLIPETPRLAKDSSQFDWSILGVAATPIDGIAKTIVEDAFVDENGEEVNNNENGDATNGDAVNGEAENGHLENGDVENGDAENGETENGVDASHEDEPEATEEAAETDDAAAEEATTEEPIEDAEETNAEGNDDIDSSANIEAESNEAEVEVEEATEVEAEIIEAAEVEANDDVEGNVEENDEPDTIDEVDINDGNNEVEVVDLAEGNGEIEVIDLAEGNDEVEVVDLAEGNDEVEVVDLAEGSDDAEIAALEDDAAAEDTIAEAEAEAEDTDADDQTIAEVETVAEDEPTHAEDEPVGAEDEPVAAEDEQDAAEESNDADAEPVDNNGIISPNADPLEGDEETHNDDDNAIVEPEATIEGIVHGEHEIESVNEEGRGATKDDKDDADIAAMVEAGNMEQLAGLVLNGDGERLMGYTSDIPELQSFLDNVPVYMNKINRIHNASREGTLKELQAALDRRKFAIAKHPISPDGASPLHVATIFGNTSIVRYLAGRFPETVSMTDDNGRTPLHYAAVVPDNGHYYNLLVHLGANTRAEDKYGHTPEFYRVNQGEFSHKILLAEYGAEDIADEMLNDKDASSSQVEMPFFCTEEGRYLASSLGDPLIKGLTEVANKRPEDPIEYLATYLYNFANNNNGRSRSRGKTQESQQLVVPGSPSFVDANNAVPANIDVVTLEPDQIPTEEDTSAFNPTSRDEHGQSMLHFAAARSHGRNALYQLLMETEINVGYRDELYRTARDISIQANIPENTVELDRYLLQIARKGDTDKLVELLLDGYDHIIDIMDEDGVPIIEAVSNADQTDTVAFLQSILAFEERRERVHHAIREGNLNDVMSMLADENDTGSGKLLAIGKNSYGRCTLHIAVLCQQEEIVDYLASTFSDTLRIGDNLERTALHYAMGIEKIESISRVLIKAGAIRVLKDLKGRQPTYYFMNKSDILRLQEEEETF